MSVQPAPVISYVSLGSNLDNPQQQVLSAVKEITAIEGVQLTAASRLYRSAPVGPGEQDDYINAVVQLETTLAPLALLDVLQTLEQAHHRKRIVRWGARTLDLDILLYGDQSIKSERLIVPHREMHWRNFVLIPLADIQPELQLPTGQSLQKLLKTIGAKGISAFADIPLPDSTTESAAVIS